MNKDIIDTKKLKKALKKLQQEVQLPEYIVEQLSDNPELILLGLKRVTKPPHSKNNKSPYDTTTKYGLLYVMFNNVKKKLNLDNYHDRYKFIDTFIVNENFVNLFKEYKKSNFDLNKRPSLVLLSKYVEHPLSKNNVNFVTHSETMKNANARRSIKVTEYRNNAPFKMYSSITEAADKSGVTTKTVRYHLAKEKGVYRYTTESDVEYFKNRKIMK